MASWLQVPAAKPDDPGSISGTHLAEGENGLPHAVLWPWEVHQGMCRATPVHTEKQQMWENLNACGFLNRPWTQTFKNPDLTVNLGLCSPLHVTWLQVFFHCFALLRFCYAPKSTCVSAFWGVRDAPPASVFIVLPILHEQPPLPTNSFVLLRSETDLWHIALPSFPDSTSAQITRSGLLWQTDSHPCSLSHLGTISVLSQPLPQCVKVTSVPKGIALLNAGRVPRPLWEK